MSMQNSSYDWKYYTEPCKMAALSLNNQRSFWPRGKLLGGSSAMNALLHVRGNKRDFDENWQSAANEKWNWESVLPYFIKSEMNHSPNIDKSYHGINGPLHVDAYPKTENDRFFEELLENLYGELNYGKLNDTNGNSYIGFGRIQGNLYKGTRQSSAKSYLHPSIVYNRDNLHIIKLAHVEKIIIDESNRATGVQFLRTIEGKTITVKAKKEIILSAGSINTPQILMLSGIGPKDHLETMKLPLIKHLNGVGGNLQDHIMVPLIFSFHKSTPPSQFPLRILAENYIQYLFNQTGTFSNLGTVDYIGFFNTENDGPFPNIQILNFLLPKGSTESIRMLLNLFNYNAMVKNSILNAAQDGDTLFALAALLNPKSRGRIELNSNDPLQPPRIFPNYLRNQGDVNTLMSAMKTLKRVTTTKTFHEHEGEMIHVELPDCDGEPNDSDQYWECYVRHLTLTLYHPSGTARMGRVENDGSVVDTNLKVHGIEGLRVADASIMPKIVSANTHATTVMIGEKVSDFIKNEWCHECETELREEL